MNKEVLLKDNALFNLKSDVYYYIYAWRGRIDMKSLNFKDEFEKSLVFYN